MAPSVQHTLHNCSQYLMLDELECLGIQLHTVAVIASSELLAVVWTGAKMGSEDAPSRRRGRLFMQPFSDIRTMAVRLMCLQSEIQQAPDDRCGLAVASGRWCLVADHDRTHAALQSAVSSTARRHLHFPSKRIQQIQH
jgi:hypothetical protein